MNYTNPNIVDTLLIALVGFAVVFVVLVVLMGLISVMSKMIGTGKPVKAPIPSTPTVPAAVPAAPAGVILENVSEQEAAMIMAIVADEMKKDPAQLQFISIKEVAQ